MHQAAINVNEVRQSVSVFADDNGVVFGSIPPQPDLKAGIYFTFDNGISPITDPSECDIVVPFSGNITSVDLIAPKSSGSIVVDLLVTDFASYPSGFTSIVDTTPPTLSGSQKYQDIDLVNWSKSLSKGQIIRAAASSVVDLTKIALTLSVTKLV